MATLRLKPNTERKLLNYYPWIYADEIEAIEGDPSPGDIVEVTSARGDFVCRAFFNSKSHIQARAVTFDPRVPINRDFYEERMRVAANRRERSVLHTNALRLVNSEADLLPGLIVDRFGPVLVIQLRNPGVVRHKDEIVRALKRVLAPSGIYERSDTQARVEEGLEEYAGLVWGEVPDRLIIFEDSLKFEVSVTTGQKTGFYLDQRDNRRLLGSLVTSADRVLDVFSYTGAFSMHASAAGAESLAVDKDKDALERLEANTRLNSLTEKVGARLGDALQVLDDLAAEGRRFSHIVLDPPTLAKHKNDVFRVKRFLTSIVARSLGLLEPGGILLLSSCAYHISANDLIESARMAANDRRRRAQVLAITHQPPDHPWIIEIPETHYLKTLILRVD